MATMNGQVLGASAMRISWGRSSSRVANQAAQQGGMAGHFGMHGERRVLGRASRCSGSPNHALQ